MRSLTEFNNVDGDPLRGILHNAKGDALVVFLHGFERTSITEVKFKQLSDKLAIRGVSTLAFDLRGHGLSDGSFKDFTIAKSVQDLRFAIAQYTAIFKDIHFVGHSLGAAIIAEYFNVEHVSNVKAVFLAPALNQRDLLRYWFVTQQMKSKDPSLKVTWDNYGDYLDEQSFVEDCQRTNKNTKAHTIGSAYFLENMERDYNDIDLSANQILSIHGDLDIQVPLQSVSRHFTHQRVIKKGNHDLERPDLIVQWLDLAVDFLASGRAEPVACHVK